MFKICLLFIFAGVFSLDAYASSEDYYKSKLSDDKNQILRFDIDNDGDSDILERWWNGKRCRWIDENDDMCSGDICGDIVSDSLQVDLNGDGIYDGYEDMCVKWVDNDQDGICDAQVVAINTKKGEENKWAGKGLYMVVVDVDNDGVMGYIDWSKFDLACWRNTGRCNFSPDYNGNSIFLKAHLATFAVTDARWNWENPFAFFDFDDDGCTEMAVRLLDDFPCNGKLNNAFVSYDVDNDSGRDNEFDYDFTLWFTKGNSYDYTSYVNDYPDLKADNWVLKYYNYKEWRMIDELVYAPHGDCYDLTFKIDWGRCYFTFDEDDDDHRWERVELYYPGDPYTLRLTKDQQESGKWPLNSHPQSDTLGDRGEFDMDNSGRGKLYISKWDGRLHLYGAEWGAWTVDKEAKYNGAILLPNACSSEKAQKLDTLVRYYDKDKNGFFDYVEFDYNADKKPDLVVNLLEYGSDEFELIDPAEEKWQGLNEIFRENANRSWYQARTIYRAFWRTGLSNKDIDDLAVASSVWEKYFHSLKLKQAIFDKLLRTYSDDQEKQKLLKQYYFTGDFDSMAKLILGV